MTSEQHREPDAPALVPMHCVALGEPGPPRQAVLRTGTPVWVVSRHADVRQVLADPRIGRAPLYAEDAPQITPVPNILDIPDTLLNTDGPEHQRIRRTVQRAFTPRAIARWRPWVASVVEELIDGLIAAGSPADAISSFTRPLPVAVICRLMGLDGLNLESLGRWSDHAMSTTAYTAEEIQASMLEFGAFGYELVVERRKQPGDDLVSSLVQAADEAGGVSEMQLTTLVIGLVVAGHETTMTSLGNALVYLLGERREAWGPIGADQQAATAAAEQILRRIPLGDRSGPLPGLMRRALEDVEVGGVVIPAGSVIAADTALANHDPEVYPADGTDLFAPLGTPSLSFGAGPHHCLGSWLARMELELGLHRLAARLPELRLAGPAEEIDWRRGLMTRSPLSLAVAW